MERKEKKIIISLVVVVVVLMLVMYALCLNTKYSARENENGEWVLSMEKSTALYAIVPEEYNGRTVDVVDLSGFCDEEKSPNLMYVYLSNSKGEFYPKSKVDGDIYSYIEYEDYVELFRYHGDNNEMIVPQTISGKPVTLVDENCFTELEQRLEEERLKQELIAAEEKQKQEQIEAEEKAERERQEAEEKERQEALAELEKERLEQEAKEEEKQELASELEGAEAGLMINDGIIIPLGISAEEVEVLCEGQELVYKKIKKGFVTCEEAPLVRRIRSDNQGCTVYGNEASNIWYHFNSDNELRQIVVKWEKGSMDSVIFDHLTALYGEPGTDWIRYLGVTECFRWDLDNGLSVFWRPEIHTDRDNYESLLMIGYTEDLSLAGPPEDGLGTYLSEYFQY